MIRMIVKYVILLALLVAVGVWFAENPGTIRLEWLGYVVEGLPISFVLLSILVVVAVGAVLYRIWVAIRNTPGAFGRKRQEGRVRKGYRALSRGMVAVAAGEKGEALKSAWEARNLLDEPGLTMLLSAQAAQLEGDEKAAQTFFEEMSRTPGMEFLGLRGLLNQALAEGDEDKALKLAERAHRIKPQSDWLNEHLFGLQVARGDWKKAEVTLESAIRYKTINREDGDRQRTVLMLQQAIVMADNGEKPQAIKLLRKALKLDPARGPAGMKLADLLSQTGKKTKALEALEVLWRKLPSSEVASLYMEIWAEPDALKRVQQAQHLARQNPSHLESRIVVARAALEAELWGQARQELDILVAENPSARVFTLMAELAESEHGDLVAAREWLRKATMADPDPAWVCSNCGHVALDWSATCSKCDSFDSYHWSIPAHADRLALDGEAADAQVTEVEEATFPDPKTVDAA